MSRSVRAGIWITGLSLALFAAPAAVSQVPSTARSSDGATRDCANLKKEIAQLRAENARLKQQLEQRRALPAPGAAEERTRSAPSSARAFPPVCSPATYVDAAGTRRVLPECRDYLLVDRGPSTDRDVQSSSEDLLMDRGPSSHPIVHRRDARDLMDYRGPGSAQGAATPVPGSCDPPVYVDRQGIRHYKRECF